MDRFCKKIIRLAFQEDLGKGDITSAAIIKANAQGEAIIIAKSGGVLSGTEAFLYAFYLASPQIKVEILLADGSKFKPKQKIARIEGPVRAMLKGERLALNLLGHLSGVATLTAEFVHRLKKSETRILDTRKTTPGLRMLEKEAVRHGGGQNHRLGLYDMILIKDNHIAAAGGIEKALQRVIKSRTKVEVEVADLKQLQDALKYSPDIIMLDNFALSQIKKAVRLVKAAGASTKIEISGGINLRNIRNYALPGVDYISVGALTHSAPAVDFSMRYVI